MSKPPHKPLRPLSQLGAAAADALAAGVAVGIACPRCGCKMWVVDTDPVVGGIRRYRVCRNCGYRKATFER